MKQLIHSVLLLIITLALLCAAAVPVLAFDTDMVYNEEELQQWFDDNSETGGTVYLADNVTITEYVYGGYQGGQIIIDTGEYGLIYDGDVIIHCDLKITGEGVNCPVLEVIDTGWSWGGGNWNNEVIDLFVTATGKDGQGGVALRISEDDGYDFAMWIASVDNGLISSYGEGAVGLELAKPLDVYCMNIKTDGTNSVAVNAPLGANLYYCRLSAAGVGAKAVSGGDIKLDTCTATPAPVGATVIDRYITDVSDKQFYMPVRQNDDILIFAYSDFTFRLLGSDGSVSMEVLPVDWDQDSIDAIDTSKLGKTEIPGKLPPIFEGFGLTDTFPLILTVEVRDLATPYIEAIYIDHSGKDATLIFWNEFDTSSGSNKLWRSDDGGNNWVDFTDSSDLEWDEWLKNIVFIRFDPLILPIMFYIEVDGIESNVATIYEKDGLACGNVGGDRTGTDRPGGGKIDVGNNPGSAGNPSIVNPGSNNPSSGNLSNNPSSGNLSSNKPSGGTPGGGSLSIGNIRSNTHSGAIPSDDNDSNPGTQNEQQDIPDVPSPGSETTENAAGDKAEGTPNRTVPVMDQDTPLAGNTPPAAIPVLALILTGSAALAGTTTLILMKIRKAVR